MNQKLKIIERKFDSMININTTFQNKVEFDIHFIQHYLFERRLISRPDGPGGRDSGSGVVCRVSGFGAGERAGVGCRVSSGVGGRVWRAAVGAGGRCRR